MGRKILKDKKGFTLIKIIIVVLIVGILTDIALNKYIKSIQQTYANEAISTLTFISDQIDYCVFTGKDITSCMKQACGFFNQSNGGSNDTAHFTIDCSTSNIGPEHKYYAINAALLQSRGKSSDTVSCGNISRSGDVILFCSQNGIRTITGVGIFKEMS